MQVIIVHGSYGAPEGNWFPWLKREVEARGHTALVPRFPTPEGQNLESWITIWQAQVGQSGEKTVLIGHSLGAAFILNLIDRDLVSSVQATFLVAGFLGDLNLPDFDKVNSTFVKGDLCWDAIKKAAGKVCVLHGDDDPYVPLSKGQTLADSLDVTLEVISKGGHLNAESGFTTFPLLIDKLQPYMKERCHQK